MGQSVLFDFTFLYMYHNMNIGSTQHRKSEMSCDTSEKVTSNARSYESSPVARILSTNHIASYCVLYCIFLDSIPWENFVICLTCRSEDLSGYLIAQITFKQTYSVRLKLLCCANFIYAVRVLVNKSQIRRFQGG